MPDIRSRTELDAQNDALTMQTRRRAGVASAQTGVNNPAGAVFVMEATWNGDDWFAVKMTQPSDEATVANLTGSNKVGRGTITGAEAVRMRRTDAGVDEGDCSLTFSPLASV